MKKRILAFAVAMALLAGCAGFISLRDHRMLVGISIQNLKDDYHKEISSSLFKAAAERNIDLLVYNADDDPQKTVKHIDMFLEKNVDAIILGTTNEDAPAEAVQRARDQGVFVLSIDQHVENANAYYGVDDYQYGYTGGTIAGDWLNEKELNGTIYDVVGKNGKIQVAVSDYRQLNSIAKRVTGLKVGLLETYTGEYEIEFVYQADAAFETDGFNLAQHVLKNWPDTSIYLCINDSAALGVYQACRLDKHCTVDNTCIVGLNATSKALEEIAKDTMFRGTVDIGIDQKGEEILSLLLDLLENNGNEEMLLWFELKPITVRNITNYV